MNTISFRTLVAFSMGLITVPCALAQGTGFTYQGRLTDGTNVAKGIYDLRFAIYDAASGGSRVGNPLTNSSVAVNGGLFTVTLDFGSEVFNGSQRWLEFGMRTNGSAADYAALSPRQPITPTPYAIHAANAKLLDGQSADSYVAKSGDTMTGRLSLPPDGLIASGNQFVLSGGNVGIGTASPTSRLHVVGQIYGSGNLASGSGVLELLHASGALGARLRSDDSGGNLNIQDRLSGTSRMFLDLSNGNVGIGTTEPNRDFALFRSSSPTLQIANSSTGSGASDGTYLQQNGSDFYVVNQESGKLILGTANAERLTIDNTGNIGIGTANPGSLLHVKSVSSHALIVTDSAAGSESGISINEAGIPKWEIYNFPYAGTDDLNFYTYDGSKSVLTMQSSGNVGIGTMAPTTKLQVVGSGLNAGTGWKSEFFSGYAGNYPYRIGFGLDASGSTFGAALMIEGTTRLWAGNDGNVGIGTTVPTSTLHVKTTGDYAGEFEKSSVDANAWIRIVNESRAYLVGVRGDTGDGFSIYDQVAGADRILINASGNVGIGTSSPQAKLHVNGDLRTSVLTITGGADVAEPFEISEENIPKGAVVVIDKENPGQLKMSERPYDKSVAGIISGANGIKPGITLSQQGVLEGGQNVALSGRVYALADATESPIKPGDLLTTSATPGHCMKATDPLKAYGTVIGKAMTGLTEGRGLVLVLVSLQ